MPREPRSKSGSEILEALYNLSLPSDEEIKTMPRDEVLASLAEDGIDLSSHRSQLRDRLTTIRAQLRLSDVRERRLATEAQIATRKHGSLLTVDEMRKEIDRRLGLLMPAKPNSPVYAYFNRFREASDEDLPALLEDLELLDEQSGGEA